MRLIDADALSKSIRNGSGTAIQKFFADACVAGAKTIEDVAPVVHAKWIADMTTTLETVKCSACKKVFQAYYSDYQYCPRCGAKMGRRFIDTRHIPMI